MKTAGQIVRTLLVAAAALAASGCLSARERALERRQPQNEVFAPAELLAKMAETEYGGLAEVAHAFQQQVCLLKLSPTGELSRRYHRRMDMTLVVVSGKAIVQVVDVRHFVEPGMVVVLPRMTAYAIKPHLTDEPFAAVLVWSPHYDPEDVRMFD